MKHEQWQNHGEQGFRLVGDLNRESVPAMWQQGKQWKFDKAELELNLSQLTRVDSAGMVMLIHLIEHAKKQNCHIMLSFVPKELRTLFQLSNVESMFAEHIKE